MGRLLTYADGRLRTGRVTFLVFAALLIVMSVLFKVNSSMDHAVLAVKHVFEPAPGHHIGAYRPRLPPRQVRI